MDLRQEQACWKLELLEVTKFDPSKKKKKKKRKPLIRDDVLFQKGLHFAEDNAPLCQSGRRLLPGHNFEPDYGYEELLSRVVDMLRVDDLGVSTETARTVMMPLRLLAQGTQITVCLNFAHLCRTMRRKPGHVIKFLLGQLETEGGLLNKQQQLEMKGLVSSQDFQAVFQRYIDTFVICGCCKSPDTALAEGNGHSTLRCEMCGLVASIREPNPTLL